MIFRTTSRTAAASVSRPGRRVVAGVLAAVLLGFALPSTSAAASAPSAAGQSQRAAPLPSLADEPVSRPLSADAAERWWLSCTAQAPSNPDAAARWMIACW